MGLPYVENICILEKVDYHILNQVVIPIASAGKQMVSLLWEMNMYLGL